MHATTVERNSWRLPPDDTVQVADQRSKSAEVRFISRSSSNSSSSTILMILSGPDLRFYSDISLFKASDKSVSFFCYYKK
jgi:hypothetical protein